MAILFWASAGGIDDDWVIKKSLNLASLDLPGLPPWVCRIHLTVKIVGVVKATTFATTTVARDLIVHVPPTVTSVSTAIPSRVLIFPTTFFIVAWVLKPWRGIVGRPGVAVVGLGMVGILVTPCFLRAIVSIVALPV